MYSQHFMEELNTAYGRLEQKQRELTQTMRQENVKLRAGWYNGHYRKNEAGQWYRDSYPITEVNLMGLCDIEIYFDRICVSTKLKRETALEYTFDKLMEYVFEAYGVEDYLSDYYRPGQTVEELKVNICASDETEIGFSFTFPFGVDVDQLHEFVSMRRQEGFYY